MKKSILLSLVAILSLAIYPTSHALATKHVITVQNFSFNPSSITDVVVGDTMRWVWVSGTHTTTSTTIPATASTWDSPITSSNTSYEYKVTVAGTYNYKCTFHAASGMIGSFVASTGAATLSVLPGNQNVSSGAGSVVFNVTSNSSWAATSSALWCTVTPSGTGNGTLTTTYSANLSVTQRIASITVTVAGIPSQIVTLTQAGAAATLSVSPGNQNVGYTSGTTLFSVSSNTNWTAISDQTWCTVTASGNGDGTVTASFSENQTNAVRVANITVSVAGIAPQVVTVTQDLSSVSVVENKAGSLSIYPNPTRANFTLSLGKATNGTVEISVINAIGTTVYNTSVSGSESYSFNFASLARGSYFIRVVSDEGTKVSKLLLIN